MDDIHSSERTSQRKSSFKGGPHFDLQSINTIQSRSESVNQKGYFLKRSCDIFLSGIALVVLSPVFLVIAFIIKITSPGPVFFRQERLGVNEKPFVILKFRSMKSDSEVSGPQFTTTNDLRITKIGKLIRKTSLDELPQLINIFRGEMSLIGPRPYIGFELAESSPEVRKKRASVRPGVSGLAQVSGRSRLSQRAAIELDLTYVDQCSFRFDFKILLQTIKKVFFCEGTN